MKKNVESAFSMITLQTIFFQGLSFYLVISSALRETKLFFVGDYRSSLLLYAIILKSLENKRLQFLSRFNIPGNDDHTILIKNIDKLLCLPRVCAGFRADLKVTQGEVKTLKFQTKFKDY